MKRSREGRLSLLGTAMVFIAGVLLGPASVAESAPRFQRLSYASDTTTTMTVSWNTMVAAESTVRYGATAGKLTDTVIGTSFEANAGLGYVHEATLTGLRPDTTYYYSVGSTTDGFSAERVFTTGPVQHERCGRFKFAFLGDNRPDEDWGGGENWPQILRQSVQQQPAFIINGGDMVISGERIDDWIKFLDWTAPAPMYLPFMPVLGNHDGEPGIGDGANYNQIFALPRSTGPHGSNTEDYYFFSYANAIFISLSTESFKQGSIPFEEQAAWLDAVLTDNPKRWKFVFLHKPIYSNQVLFDLSHGGNEEGQNEAFVSVIDKHHVDVVVTSHNHWYERYEPSACGTAGNPASEQPCSVGATNFAAGTVYYVSGGAGAYTIPGILCGLQAGRAACAGNHHYLIFEVDNEVLNIDTWAAFPEANQVFDTITITKGGEACPRPPDASVTDGAAARDSGALLDGARHDSTGPAIGEPSNDAGPTSSDGSSPASSSSHGCGCRVAGDGFAGLSALPLAFLLGWLRRRNARR